MRSLPVRTSALAFALALLLPLARSSTLFPPPPAPAIVGVPVVLDPLGLAPATGRLQLLGAWLLRSADPRFGGISAMVADDAGLLAISDRGTAIRLTVRGGRVAGRVLGDLPTFPRHYRKQRRPDTEAMTRDPQSGRLWVGFEGPNAIWRFGPGLDGLQAGAAPRAMRRWRSNKGAEAIVRLADGRFVVMCEARRGPGSSAEALLFTGDPALPGTRAIRFWYRAPKGYRATDAALLPDGRVLLLHRRFTPPAGVSAMVALLDPRAIRADRVMVPMPIAWLAPPRAIDNMESLAVTRERGRTTVWIASDDNFSAAQRSLLLKFMLR